MREMKDSGVAWIGAVPSDYRTASIGSLFTIKKDIIGREPETVLSITQTGIRPKDLSSNEGQNASSYANYQIVNVGDFAMNHMDLLTGWIDISKYEGVTSPDYRVFTLNDKEMSADYFLRVFQYYYTDRVFFGFGQGVATLGRWRLPAINFKKIDVPVPPVLEQQRIVAAIDEKVGKVDTLIANVQAQIEKLKAYKQSVITEVVTKGLDHTVPMKDSGIGWIGEIPESWEVKPMLREIETIVDYRGKTPEKVAEGTLLVTARNIKDGRIDYSISREYVKPEEYDEIMHRGKLNIGDVLFTTEAPLGAVANVDRTDFALAQRIIKFTTKNSLNPYYLKYWMLSPIFQQHLKSYATGSTASGIKASKLCLLQLVHPPRAVQDDIVSALDSKCDQVDRLIAIKQAKIEKLEQYKRSLIYEHVTGKREVV